jgi:thioredoxin reductase (NADPH)
VTERLDNFPGFPEGVSGAEFADRLRRQAERFGVEILAAQEVTGLAVDGEYRSVRTADGGEYRAWAVLLAPGSTYRRLGIPGEEDFIGAGVHFCATCDGPFYRDRDVLVIGGGNSAAEESIFLARFARRVTIATRGDRLSASKVVTQKLAESARIDILTGVTPAAFTGADRLGGVTLRETATGQTRELAPAGVFVFIGLMPNTALVRGLVELDERGFIVTGPTLETSVPGVFAAGDCRAGSTKQAASAAGEGAAVALAIRQYVEPRASGMPGPALVETATG